MVVDEQPDGSCILDVGGVGYEVFLPLGSLGRVGGEQDEVTLHIHTHVREDALLLYGFPTPEDRAAFRLILGVSGVGPKIALAIMGAMGAQQLSDVIARQDMSAFKGISGVGKKTAERLMLELKDKLPRIHSSSSGQVRAPRASAAGPGATVVGALVQMGFKRAQAERAVSEIANAETKSAEELLRDALAQLG